MTKSIPVGAHLYALIDDADYEMVSCFRWHDCPNGKAHYARTVVNYGPPRRSTSMHRLILHAPIHLMVDHMNGNTLDNRRSNLRLCTARQNECNARRSRSNKSGYKGVSWDSHGHKWRAAIVVNRKQVHLGMFRNPTEAAEAYDRAAREYYGEFAHTNFLDT